MERLCRNGHDKHDCGCFENQHSVRDLTEGYELQGLPMGTIIMEAIWRPCDGSCIESKYGACKRHIECNCCHQGKEFFHLLVGTGATYLMNKTKMRIFKILTPQPESKAECCPQCGCSPLMREGRCWTCPGCGTSACG